MPGSVLINADSARLPRVRFLGGNDRNGISPLGFHEQNLAVVVGEICAADYLRYEHPQFDRLVRGLMVKNEIEAADEPGFLNEEKSAQKLLGYGERCLPYLRNSNLVQYPLNNVSDLYGIAQISLKRRICQQLQYRFY